MRFGAELRRRLDLPLGAMHGRTDDAPNGWRRCAVALGSTDFRPTEGIAQDGR
jgi:hypothetical protein